MFKPPIIPVVFASLLFLPRPVEAFIVINEILADPPAGALGDANNDGVTSSGDDEFIELYNSGPSAVDLSSWYITDEVKVRHIFEEGSMFSDGGVWVVFGGGDPDLAGIDWFTASSGSLGLNNTGDTVTLYNQDGIPVDTVAYGKEGGNDQSLTRSPEGEGDVFVAHPFLEGAGESPYSAGYFVRPVEPPATPDPGPEPGPDGDTAAVPEPATIFTFALGALMFRRPPHRPLLPADRV